MKEVTIYTDGACSGNPGPGGYGVVLKYRGHRRELKKGYRRTTNNRMELRGAIAALEALKEACIVQLYTDSQYLVKAINEHWLENWRARGWRTASKQPVKNVDLWERFAGLLATHQVEMHWVKGHASNEENNRCDELAREAAHAEELPEDPGFEE